MTGKRLAPIPASGQRSTQLRPHSGATGNSPLWKIPKKAELFELECMVFDRVSWSETPAFHNTLVVGSSPSSSTTQSRPTGDPRSRTETHCITAAECCLRPDRSAGLRTTPATRGKKKAVRATFRRNVALCRVEKELLARSGSKNGQSHAVCSASQPEPKRIG